MDKSNKAIEMLTMSYLRKNYNYEWLKTMLHKASKMTEKETLVTGSSHALAGISESCFTNCINCSMHSQDLYYDFLCAKNVLETGQAAGIEKCFVVMGYYIPFQDLSLSSYLRETWVSNVYYPIFHDAHNWENSPEKDLWEIIGEVPEEARRICEKLSEQMLLQRSTYYSDLKQRKPFFDFSGKEWHSLLPEEKEEFGKKRADSHNNLIKHEASMLENREILKDYVHFLHMKDVLPIVVITPFTASYNRYIESGYKTVILEMLGYVSEEVHFVDFNESDFFDDKDFVDTDHLNADGAMKLSFLLTQMFGR